MKRIASYMKRNRLWMACTVLMMAFALFYMFLMHVCAWDIMYFAGLELFLLVMLFVSGFAAYVGRIRKLEEAGNHLKNESTLIRESGDMIENLYQEMIEDVSMKRKLEAAAYARNQTEMREYYSMWVHQIKTPISALQLLLQVQRNQMENGELLQQQSEMEKELFDIEQYVNMALQYQRVNTPGNDYILEKLHLDELVREVVRKYAKIMVRRRIPLQYAGTDIMVTTDAKWVSFAIEQILSNAIKYSHEGQSIKIETVHEPDWDYLKITDHGIGIKAEDLTRVFENGYTGYNGHSDKKSTGIGLHLSKLVLNKLGHSIRLESEYGIGTTVWIGFQKRKK